MNTIQKLTRDLGEAVLAYQDKTLVNLPCKRVQCDEIWGFAYAKDKTCPTKWHAGRRFNLEVDRALCGYQADSVVAARRS